MPEAVEDEAIEKLDGNSIRFVGDLEYGFGGEGKLGNW
jgi:hypothetical protein